MPALLAVACGDDKKLTVAIAQDVDGIILDLEDGVPEERKPSARRRLAEQANTVAAAGITPYVRINSISTRWWRDDIAAVAQTSVSHLLVPKTESRDEVVALDHELNESVAHPVRFALVVETRAALERLPTFAASSERVSHIGVGISDMCADIGMRWSEVIRTNRPQINEWRAQIIRYSHALKLGPPLDCVWLDLQDDDGLRSDTLLGRLLGFAGRTAIDPAQVRTINEVYRAYSPRA